MNSTTLYNSICSKLKFVANAQQSEAIKALSEFVFHSSYNQLFLLKGYAGTGKSSLLAAFTNALSNTNYKSVLLAPTGRAAKVLSGYSQRTAFTIHRKIFQVAEFGGRQRFVLSHNPHKNTIFVVDEASMIGVRQDEYLQNDLLSSLLEYVHSGNNCKLILIGDTAQLPPVGSEDSQALNPEFLKTRYSSEIVLRELTTVERQKEDSGILYNATKLRISLLEPEFVLPKIEQTDDCFNVMGESLEDQLNQAYSQYGMENVLIVTRSNKRANLFNKNIRNRIQLFEEDINAGDNLMVVKNNYYWLNEIGRKGDFIANGDMMEISKIIRREKLYGFEFADCLLRFTDLNDKEIEAKLILESLYQDQAAMSNESFSLLQQEVLMDVEDLSDSALKFAYLKKSPHYNALQVKFSYAITCHKAQGGQWPCVFIDHGYLSDEMMDKSFIRWLYTAITRATDQVYLVNFNPKLL